MTVLTGCLDRLHGYNPCVDQDNPKIMQSGSRVHQSPPSSCCEIWESWVGAYALCTGMSTICRGRPSIQMPEGHTCGLIVSSADGQGCSNPAAFLNLESRPGSLRLG